MIKKEISLSQSSVLSSLVLAVALSPLMGNAAESPAINPGCESLLINPTDLDPSDLSPAAESMRYIGWIKGYAGRNDLVLRGTSQLLNLHYQNKISDEDTSSALSAHLFEIFTATLELEYGKEFFTSVVNWLSSFANADDIGRIYAAHKKGLPREHSQAFKSPTLLFLTHTESLVLRLSIKYNIYSYPRLMTREKTQSLSAYEELLSKYGKLHNDSWNSSTIPYTQAYSFEGQLLGFYRQAFIDNSQIFNAEILKIDPLNATQRDIYDLVSTNLRSFSFSPQYPIDFDSDHKTPSLVYVDLLSQLSVKEAIGLNEDQINQAISYFHIKIIEPENLAFFRGYDFEFSYLLTLVSVWDLVLSHIFEHQGQDWIPHSDDLLPMAFKSHPAIFNLLGKTSKSRQVRLFSQKVLESQK